jgi:hypothetical protein
MVESLKRSIERLQPPGCIHCRIKMVWYRSVRAAELDEIIHYFQCVNCNRIVEVTTKMRSDENGKGSPPKRARPAHRRGNTVFALAPVSSASNWRRSGKEVLLRRNSEAVNLTPAAHSAHNASSGCCVALSPAGLPLTSLSDGTFFS